MSTNNHVVVIGGGVAGIQAALDLADYGIKVYLVETKPAIGGRMAQLDKTFPTNDCSICILSPKLREVGYHENIELLTNSDVIQVDGEAGRFKVKVKKRARYVREDRCTACGACTEKCPTKCDDEFEMKLGKRKAIYSYYQQGIPATYVIDPERCIKLTKGKCGICLQQCEREAIDFEQQDEEVVLDAAAVVLATGFEAYDPTPITQYGYGRVKDVMTALEFERLSCASGPTAGHLVRKDGSPAKELAFIQCVGSRNRRTNAFCSEVCCMHATKEAQIAYEHDPDVRSTIFYTDLRAGGKSFQNYITKAREVYHVDYIKGRPGSITLENDRPTVWYEDTEHDRYDHKSFDIVILCTSLVPRKETPALAQILGIELDCYGFVKTDHFEPEKTTRPGILACGYCRGPADIPESVAQGSGAAALAATIASPSEVLT